LPVADRGGPSSPRKVPYPSQEKGEKIKIKIKNKSPWSLKKFENIPYFP